MVPRATARPIYLLDTNILVHYVRGSAVYRRVEATYALTAPPVRPLISIVSVGELLSLARRWNWGAGKRQIVQELLVRVSPVSLGFSGVTNAYAEIDDHSRRNGIAMSKNDVWIAATAHVTGAHLLTTDRDFDHLSPACLARDWIDPVT